MIPNVGGPAKHLKDDFITNNRALVPPYKGELVNLVVDSTDFPALFSYASSLRSIQLSRRQTCDLEMLSTGAFSPLTGFLSEKDHKCVVDEMRLADGTIFPIPITLSVDELTSVRTGQDVALRDPKNELLAVLTIEEIYEWDREQFCETVLGTFDLRHPLVAEIQSWGRFNLSGALRVLKLPEYHDFCDLRLSPRQSRERLETFGRENVVAFQTRNPMHRAHEALTKKAIEITDGTLLLHPVVGMTKPGDIDHFTRVRAYKTVVDEAFPKRRVLLALLPLAMRFAGPREAVLHAIVRRNYGASHFIVGRDHASPGTDGNGRPFYDASAAQLLARNLSTEIGVTILAFQEFAYLPDGDRFEEMVGPVTPSERALPVSGKRMREDFLERGKQLPEWFARKEVARILSESYPPRHRQGFCLWFTGLSGSGKSTTADIVAALLLEEGRQSTVLDGDVVRTHLSKGLGFSAEDRDTNIKRIGFVASEIVRHGGVAICAAVSPYRQSRNQVRLMLQDGHFVEIFVDTPLDVCESRDAKGMYAKARRGDIKGFTGIDDVYEVPQSPEITLETEKRTARDNALTIIDHLRSSGFLTKMRHHV